MSSITITARKGGQLTAESAIDVDAMKWLERTQVENNVPIPVDGERQNRLSGVSHLTRWRSIDSQRECQARLLVDRLECLRGSLLERTLKPLKERCGIELIEGQDGRRI